MIVVACWIVAAVFFGSCDRSPEAKLAKHVKRGDAYVKEEKFREAAIEYRNAVKAVPKDPAAHWKLAKASLEAKDIRTGFAELQKTVELDPNNFEALGKLGEIYVMAGKKDEATQIADNLVKSRPNDPQGYILQSGLAVRAGKVDEGIAKLKKAAELDPKRIRTLLTIGNMYLLKRDRKSAQEWYDKALAADPNAVDVHVTRGNFFFASGERDEGEKEYRKAIELSKEKETLRIALAEHYLYQGRMEESEKELNAIIKEMNSQKARKVLAEIKLETGKVAEAKPIVDAILKENEKDLDGKYLKGRIALAENRLDDAKALFGDVVKQDAGMARARLYNGLTEIQQGQVEVGRKEIEEAVKLDPGNARAQLLLGEVSLRSGAPAAAEKAALEVLRRNPSNVLAAILLADSFLARKEWKKGEQIYQAMMKQLPKSPVGYLKMGLSRKLQGKPKEAAGFFAQAVEKNPKDLTAINEYIFALAAAKDTAKAKKVLDETVAKEPKNPLLWDMVGRFQLASGKPAEAEAAFLKSIELAPEFTAPYYQLGVIYAAQKKFPEAEMRLGEGHREERQERRRARAARDGDQLRGEDRRGEQGVPEGADALAEAPAGGEQPGVEPGRRRREPGRGVEVRPDRPGGGPRGPERGGYPRLDLLQEGVDRDRLPADRGRRGKVEEQRLHPLPSRDGACEEGEEQGGGRRAESRALPGPEIPRRRRGEENPGGPEVT